MAREVAGSRTSACGPGERGRTAVAVMGAPRFIRLKSAARASLIPNARRVGSRVSRPTGMCVPISSGTPKIIRAAQRCEPRLHPQGDDAASATGDRRRPARLVGPGRANNDEAMTVATRNRVRVSGVPMGRPMVFAHGYGCDQEMWRLVAPDFEVDHRVVLFDHVGAGKSDLSAYDPDKYGSLRGYATDVVEICRELGLSDVVFVGHSVSAMVGVLALQQAPELFGALVMIGPNPRYVDDDPYVGGFTRADVAGLLEALDANHLGWSAQMAPMIMGNPDRPELAEELTNSFCR